MYFQGTFDTWLNVSIVRWALMNAESSFLFHWKSKKLLCIPQKQVHGRIFHSMTRNIEESNIFTSLVNLLVHLIYSLLVH